MANVDLSAEEVRQILSYCPITGELRWRSHSAPRARAGALAGSKEPQGYIAIGIRGGNYKAHRLAWLITLGEWPDGEVDHINGNRSDNRLCNLRLTNRATNMQNQRHAHARKNSTGLLGVSRRPSYFEARIQVNKRSFSLGRFDSAEAAHEAYLKAKRLMHISCTI